MKSKHNNTFVKFIVTGVMIFIIGSCSKENEEDSIPFSTDTLSAFQLQILEEAGIDTISTFEDALFPDSSNISEWLKKNDSGYTYNFSKQSTSYSCDKKRLFIGRMTRAGLLLVNDELYSAPYQNNGLAYIYNSKTIMEPYVWPPAVCQEPLYGLDCSGMIYQMALASNINLGSHGTVNYVNVNIWNNAFNNSPDFQGLEMIDMGTLPASKLEAGDIIVAPDVHIGMIFNNVYSLGVLNSVGSPDYTCAKNSDALHGPVIKPNVQDWLAIMFNNNYHVLRVKANEFDLSNTTWDFFIDLAPYGSWHADVTFYSNGATYYDEPEFPGYYTMFGTWVVCDNVLFYDLDRFEHTNTRYQFTGFIDGNTMSGTLTFGNENDKYWRAVKY